MFNYLKKEFVNKIAIKRTMALGDVLLTTPIVKKLREVYGDSVTIDFITDIPSVYKNNPHINNILPKNHSLSGYDLTFDLDLVYERNPSAHIIDSYSQFVFGNKDIDKQTYLFPVAEDRNFVVSLLDDLGLSNKNYVVVHMGVTGRNRTWPKESWEATIKKLTSLGYFVVVVGKKSDFNFSGDKAFSLVDKLSVQQVQCIIENAGCFVGNDSGMLHVAGTTKTPIVGLFTSAKGEYRVPFREGVLSLNTTIVRPSLECYGCLEKEKPPVENCECQRRDYACLKSITPDNVFNAIQGHIKNLSM